MPAIPTRRGPLHQLGHLSFPYDPQIAPLGANPGVVLHETYDCFEQACTITAWQQLYDQLSPGDFHGQLKELWLDQLQCFEEYTNRALRQSCIAWPDAYWFGIPCPEQPDAACNGARLDDHLIAISSGGEFELTTPDNFHIMGLVIPCHELEAYARIMLDGEMPPGLAAAPHLQVDPQYKQSFIHRQRALLAAADRHQLNTTAYRFMRNELLDSLTDLLTSAGPAPRQHRSRQHHWRTVRKVRDIVMSQPDEPLAIADLCYQLGVSRRTLQNIFRNTLEICPLSYLKSLRLNAVRRELLSHDSCHQSVQDVAAAWGFWHMSQFAVDYGKLFGERPSSTLRRRILQSNCHTESPR